MTEIEHWLRDPYTIYAKHILRLTPLDPIGAEPGAAERGTFIHNAIGEFTQRFAKKLPDDPARALIELGRPHFATLNDYPEARAFWWPRFERIARWFARWEMARRARRWHQTALSGSWMVGGSTAAALATMSAKWRPCSLPREGLRRLLPSKMQCLPSSRRRPSRISVLDTRRFIASSHRNSHVEYSNLKVAQSSER